MSTFRAGVGLLLEATSDELARDGLVAQAINAATLTSTAEGNLRRIQAREKPFAVLALAGTAAVFTVHLSFRTALGAPEPEGSANPWMYSF